MRTYNQPDNLLKLLGGVVQAASKTTFYSGFLGEHANVESLDDFAAIPLTPLERYRRQRLADVLAEPGQVDWIVGPYRGQSADSVAVAEGPDEGESRYDVFADAVKECLPLDEVRSGAVVASSGRRQFGAELATILIYAGVPSHLFIDSTDDRTYERLGLVRPDVLVLAAEPLDESLLPSATRLCVTFRRTQMLRRFQQLDMYLVDELGFLGQSNDGVRYSLNRDLYYFETSDTSRLVVTALHNKVQPLLRIEIPDRVKQTGTDPIEFIELATEG